MQTAALVRAYLSDVQRLLETLDIAFIEEMTDALQEAWQAGRRVLFMGNGGSSSSVSHIVNDLQKNIQLETGRALRALCLTDNTPLLMAWANDTEWGNVFAPQVHCWAEPGDIVIGVSGSGNSSNVIHGICAANAIGARTFGMAGYQGGRLLQTARRCLVVPSENMQRIEDVHMIALHTVFSALLHRVANTS